MEGLVFGGSAYYDSGKIQIYLFIELRAPYFSAYKVRDQASESRVYDREKRNGEEEGEDVEVPEQEIG